MNMRTFTEYSNSENFDEMQYSRRNIDSDAPHLALQVLSIIAFGVIGIVAVSLAFAAFWVAGLVTTIVIAIAWANSRFFGGHKSHRPKEGRQTVRDVAPIVQSKRSSGNVNFDAYRTQMIQSLEQESREFEGFLTRLRDAEGKMEFDQYMDDRAQAAKDARAETIGTA